MRNLLLLSVFGILALVIIELDVHAQAEEAKASGPMVLMVQDELEPARSLAGSYLAGRFAQRHLDWDAAQSYMNTAATLDQDNELILQRAFLLSLGAAEYTRAKELALTLADKNHTELALIYLACDALSHDEFKKASDYISRLPDDGFGQYTKPLLTAWSLVGDHRTDDAIALLRSQTDPKDPTFNIHAGMIEEFAGNMKAAAKYYRVAVENGLTMHTAVLAARFFQRNGQQDIAEAIYDNLGKIYPFNPFVNALNNTPSQVSANVTKPADGASIALFDLATLLYERRAYDSAQIYGNLALLLTPKAPFTMLMMGDIAAVNAQYNKAVADYQSIPENSPAFWLAQMRVAEVHEVSGHLDQAIALLNNLSHNKETRLQAFVTLGDIYRRHEQFDKALEAYNTVLSEAGPMNADHWPILYARGMSLERLDDWAGAEKDLMAALAYQPNNPMILNFIGYSWADQGVNLDKALDYTKRAAAMRPDDGYIVDSYGWALYRNGKFEESISWLEKAAELAPDDSTVLNHLGDAYWQTGRKIEAKFKWHHAFDLSKDTSFRSTIQDKIKNGLSAEPQVAHNNGGNI